MALKKPLVITDGQIQQIQSGDTIDGVVSGGEGTVMENNNAGTANICTVVYCDGNDTVDLAQGDAAGTAQAFGLVADASIAAGASGNIRRDGILVATTAAWDAVTGEVGGLVAGEEYFVSKDTAGKLVIVAPSAVGEYVCFVGHGISTTEMELSIERYIKL